jgi:hypothetical protein
MKLPGLSVVAKQSVFDTSKEENIANVNGCSLRKTGQQEIVVRL